MSSSGTRRSLWIEKEADIINMEEPVAFCGWGMGEEMGETQHGGWTDSVPAGLAKQSPKIHSFVTTILN